MWPVYINRNEDKYSDIAMVNSGGGGSPHFNGLSNRTINQGEDFDLTEGVTALDKDGNEIPFTVSPDSVDKCEVGEQTFTYTAEGVEDTRTITVTQADAPTISGLTPLEVEVNEEFDPLDGVTAIDDNGNEVEVTYEEPPVPPEPYVIMVDESNYTAPNNTPTPQTVIWQYEGLEYEVEDVFADGVPVTVTNLTTENDTTIHLVFSDFIVSLHDGWNGTFTSTVGGINPPNEVTFGRLIIKYIEH